ncbi:MAG TPA: helix-turn-helix domain-containing protein [Dehalococcoidia bacterium]|jgi:AcrR family transcriptional regulator
MEAVNPPQRTPYRQLQAQETRRRIASAARRLFAAQGYGGTSIEAVADEAGVAVRTVYAAFGTKKAILAAICDEWLNEAGVFPMIQQALQEADASRRLALIARLNRQQWERGRDIVQMLEGAALADPEIARMLDGWKEQRAGALAQVIEGCSGRLAPGLDLGTAAAIVRALSAAELYRELVQAAGWSGDRYEEWLTSLLVRELLSAMAAP